MFQTLSLNFSPLPLLAGIFIFSLIWPNWLRGTSLAGQASTSARMYTTARPDDICCRSSASLASRLFLFWLFFEGAAGPPFSLKRQATVRLPFCFSPDFFFSSSHHPSLLFWWAEGFHLVLSGTGTAVADQQTNKSSLLVIYSIGVSGEVFGTRK